MLKATEGSAMDAPLGLDPETMRRLGYRTVDMLVDRLSAVAEVPVFRRFSTIRRLFPPAGIT